MSIFKNQFFAIILLLFLVNSANGQVCNPDAVIGPNLVVNPGFESGDTGFITSIACSWNDPACDCHNNSYSQPNEYYIGGSPSESSPCGNAFQSGFSGSPHSGSKFMMIDGIGKTASTVWEQTVNVDANSYYYFQVWIATLADDPDTRARLKFTIGNDTLPTIIDAPATSTIWEDYTTMWYSNGYSGPIVIRIIDIQSESEDPDQDDFGLDDIVFKKGCPPDAYVEQPDLGPDLSFCGTSATSFTLDPQLTLGPGQSISWSTGAADANKSTIDVSTAGTYYVCLSQTGSCSKIDSIVVTDTYSIELGSNTELCNPSNITLDAVHAGPGITYQWYKDGTAIIPGNTKTQFVNTPALYKVVVTDPKCNTQSDSITVDMKSGAVIPNNIDFCRRNNPDTTITFSVSPVATTYDWYDVETGGAVLAGGAGTASYAKSGIVYGDTLYAQDKAMTAYNNQGPGTTNASAQGNYDTYTYDGVDNDFNRQFDALVDINLVSVQMKGVPHQGPCSGKGSGTSNNFTVTLYKDGVAQQSKTDATMNCGGAWSAVTLNFAITAGTGYELGVTAGSGWFHISKQATDADEMIIPDILEIKASTHSKKNSGAFFNWSFAAASPCSRTPVMARDICILPVEFLRFSVAPIGDNVLLSWSTALERNSNYFEVERFNGENFEVVGVVKAISNASEINNYQFIDKNPPSGISYYRIKLVDFDGATSYSKVETVSMSDLTFNLYPNPYQKSFTLFITEAEEQEYLVTISDISGSTIYSGVFNSNAKHELGEMLEKGIYVVTITNGLKTFREKLVKH